MHIQTMRQILPANFLSSNHNNLLSHYRSKLYVNHFTANTILASAGPVLSLLERINISNSLPPLEQLHSQIEHELTAFHCRLTTKNYNNDIFAIAYYLITATTDEIIAKNYLKHNNCVEFQAFTPASTDNTMPQQRFFDLLDILKSKPTHYLDLLELAYYCLIAGFEGIYHTKAYGRQYIDNTLDEIFQILSSSRKHKPIRLLNPPANYNIKKRFNKNIIFSILFLMTVITGIYISSDSILDNKAKTIFMKTSLWTER